MAEQHTTALKKNELRINALNTREEIYQAINIFAEQDFNPNTDEDVLSVLRDDLNIRLPQRSTLDDSLASAASDHEIIALILKYRALS